MLDYKDGLMVGETPRCRRERITADLTDAAQRRAIYAAVGPEPVFLITEGLLAYLPAATVDDLASEAWLECGIVHWMTDIMTTQFSQALNLNSMQSVRHVQAQDALTGEQILECVRRHGWVTAARRSYITDMAFARERIRRIMGDRVQAGPPPALLGDPTGVHRFGRG